MKRLIVLTLALFTCISYKVFSQKKDITDASLQLPYKMQLNNISFGNSIYVEKVLWYWKEYCDNKTEKSADLFADDVVAIFPSGTTLKGKEMLMLGGQQYRDLFTSIACEITACLALKSPDDPEHQLVTIWGIERIQLKTEKR